MWYQMENAETTKHIDYADDICLLAEEISDVSLMANAVKADLKINIGKTKLLSLAAGKRSIAIDEEHIENVKTLYSCELAEVNGFPIGTLEL